MPKPAQFDLALVRPRSPAPVPMRRKPELQGATRVLRNRRIRLHRLIERTQATIAEIEDELRSRGVAILSPPKRHGLPLPFRHNELPRLALNVLRANGQAMHVREIAAAILVAKGLDPMDRALADATVKRLRFVLLLHKRTGIVRLLGLQRARSARWALTDG
jgi:hypothetical protein